MTTQQDLDAQLRAELEKLRQRDPGAAAQLLAQALGRPAGRSPTEVGPALPKRTQHHSPLESESRFVRYCGWWNERFCEKCGATERTFGGLFEEREWNQPSVGGPRHFLACSVAPLPELLRDAVTYTRYYKLNFCHECIGAAQWPLAGQYTPEQVEIRTTVKAYKDGD